MWTLSFSFDSFWLFNFAVSKHIFFLLPATLFLIFICEYAYMCLCSHVRLISGLAANKHCRCDCNYKVRSTDISCCIIYISVTTMYFLNLEIWQMVFVFQMFVTHSLCFPNWWHLFNYFCARCDGGHVNVGLNFFFTIKSIPIDPCWKVQPLIVCCQVQNSFRLCHDNYTEYTLFWSQSMLRTQIGNDLFCIYIVLYTTSHLPLCTHTHAQSHINGATTGSNSELSVSYG